MHMIPYLCNIDLMSTLYSLWQLYYIADFRQCYTMHKINTGSDLQHSTVINDNWLDLSEWTAYIRLWVNTGTAMLMTYLLVKSLQLFHLRVPNLQMCHDDVIKWKHFPRNWPFVREIHRSPVNFPHKGQWRGALMFSLINAWINDWVNNREASDLRR